MALDTYTYFPLMFFFTVRDNQSVRSGDLIGLLYWRAYFYSSNKEFDPQNLNIKDEHGDVLELCHEVRADIAGLIKTDGLPWRGMPPAMGQIHTDYIASSIPSDFTWVPEQISVDTILFELETSNQIKKVKPHDFENKVLKLDEKINKKFPNMIRNEKYSVDDGTIQFVPYSDYSDEPNIIERVKHKVTKVAPAFLGNSLLILLFIALFVGGALKALPILYKWNVEKYLKTSYLADPESLSTRNPKLYDVFNYNKDEKCLDLDVRAATTDGVYLDYRRMSFSLDGSGKVEKVMEGACVTNYSVKLTPVTVTELLFGD